MITILWVGANLALLYMLYDRQKQDEVQARALSARIEQLSAEVRGHADRMRDIKFDLDSKQSIHEKKRKSK